MALMASSPPGDRERGLRERDRRRRATVSASASRARRPARAAAARATASATGTATGGGGAPRREGPQRRGGALVPLDLGAEGARRALGVREAVIDGCRRGRDGARGPRSILPISASLAPRAASSRTRSSSVSATGAGAGAGSPAGVRSRAAWAVSRSLFAFFCFFCFFAFFAFLRVFSLLFLLG